MLYRATERYQTSHGTYEGPIVITDDLDTALAAALERFFELYNSLCSEVGDSLDTFVRIGTNPTHYIPLLAIRQHINETYRPNDELVISMDGGDYVSVQPTEAQHT